MNTGILKIAFRSIVHYRKQILYQILIIALLTAVITGSLMTGSSVRNSLKKAASSRLGRTGILISSGTRYFDRDLVRKMKENAVINCTGLLELNGSSQVLTTQAAAPAVKIYAVTDEFFRFNRDTVKVSPGEVLVNKRLAEFLNIRKGSELIIRFSEINDIPADAPFAPAKGEITSIVLKTGNMLQNEPTANFSLSINQIEPMNVFINLSDLENNYGKKLKFNRLLIDHSSGKSADEVNELLKTVLEPSDIGLRIRKIRSTGGYELISDRIFVDEGIISETERLFPSSSPVITYLANSIKSSSGSTPYSFVSGLPATIYNDIPGNNGIYVNRWLADDSGVSPGDSLGLTWYAPDSLNHLAEKSRTFLVEKVVDNTGIWADSLLMPDFPGISGSESCSGWDAGVPVETGRIRPKDEEYWNKHRGTPKAFLSYETAREIWGSNYGPATSIRFSSDISGDRINSGLKGNLDPAITGFLIDDLYGESMRAADEGVDFGSLFLSLGFFLIVAAIVLLSFTLSYYFDLKRSDTRILYSLGFRRRKLSLILFAESSATAITGCFAGAFAGYLVNVLITSALNSVWIGAVQTNTLRPSFEMAPVLTGFCVSFPVILFLIIIKIRNYLKIIETRHKPEKAVSSKDGSTPVIISVSVALLLFMASFFSVENAVILSFLSGAAFLPALILFIRFRLVRAEKQNPSGFASLRTLSNLYYSFYPSHAITPVLFIAAGLFAFFITTVNRKTFDDSQSVRSSGTGGYLLWTESALPLRDDMNSERGRRNLGLDDDSLISLSFVQMKKYAGNDASCLNLNHITAPPLLGVDVSDFIKEKAFSFASVLKGNNAENPWQYLDIDPGNQTIYGIADQTVLDWGLKLKPGDTLQLRSENGKPLRIIIAAGLQSSVFQGYVLIGEPFFSRYFPSVAGHSVFMAAGDKERAEYYITMLNDRLSGYGTETRKTSDRLSSFYQVTNTYLSVFSVFGGLGLMTGVAGLGFVLLRNYSRRKKEYALMLSTGFSFGMIRRMLFREQFLIIVTGIIIGFFSAVVATFPSLKTSHDIPWLYIAGTMLVIVFTGIMAVSVSLRSVNENSLIGELKKE